tara:strand:+ start:244 stop:504 length:261 start_codon:yes stop_codon:yes gene_type:complete
MQVAQIFQEVAEQVLQLQFLEHPQVMLVVAAVELDVVALILLPLLKAEELGGLDQDLPQELAQLILVVAEVEMVVQILVVVQVVQE